MKRPPWNLQGRGGFSLVEVVLALGVVAVAIVAILGILPAGLKTSHSAQDDTRAAQIAQDILTSIASQSQNSFPSAKVVQPSSNFSYNIDLGSPKTYDTLAADNNGNLRALASPTDSVQFPYQVLVKIDPDPTGFDGGYASVVTVRVAWQPFAQNYRDFVRIITKY